MNESNYEAGQDWDRDCIFLPREMLDSPEWDSLTAHEMKMVMHMACDYTGDNNGSISCTWSRMSKRGWRSRQTLDNVIAGLLEKGFIVRTRRGARRVCSLYALTWEPIDPGEHDATPSGYPLNLWRAQKATSHEAIQQADSRATDIDQGDPGGDNDESLPPDMQVALLRVAAAYEWTGKERRAFTRWAVTDLKTADKFLKEEMKRIDLQSMRQAQNDPSFDLPF